MLLAVSGERRSFKDQTMLPRFGLQVPGEKSHPLHLAKAGPISNNVLPF